VYKLEYLPSAQQDLKDIVSYVAKELANPTAAERLAQAFYDAGEQIAEFPYADPAYTPLRPLIHEYRKHIVRNYLMFYWVNEQKKCVTIARVIYARRDYRRILI